MTATLLDDYDVDGIVEETGAEANSLGLFNGLFGHARAAGKPGWVKVTADGFDLPPGASRNVMLLRAVQFGSDAYVVFAAGTVEEVTVDLSPALLELLEGAAPVAFVVWGMTNAGNWRRALPKLGIAGDWEPSLAEGGIDGAAYAGRTVPWSAPTVDEYPVHTAVISPEDVTGEIAARGRKDGRDLALIVRKGNKYLVNANVLHLQASFIFNGLFGGPLREPFYGYGTTGERSAFLALKETELVVDLPFEEGAEIRVTRFGASGRVLEDEETTYRRPLRTRLKEHELLVVEPA